MNRGLDNGDRGVLKGEESGACPLRGHRAASPSGLSRFASSLRGITWRGALSKLRDFLFERPTDAIGRVNLWCSAIAIVALVAIWAIYLETWL